METKTPTAVRVTEHPVAHPSAGNVKYVDVSNIQPPQILQPTFAVSLKTISEVWGKNVGC